MGRPELHQARNTAFVLLAAMAGLFEAPAQVAAVVAALFALATVQWSRRSLTWLEVGLLAWLLAGLPGLITASGPISGNDAARPLAALLYVVGRATPTGDPILMRRMAWAFCVACVINGAYGLVQVFIFDPPLEHLIIRRVASAHLVDPSHPQRLHMASGLFYNRVKLAHVGAVGLGCLAVIALSSDATVRTRRLSVVGFLILGAGIYLTYRRAAPAALFVALVALAALIRRRAVLAAGLGSAALFGAAFLAFGAGRRRLAAASGSFDERLEIYRTALRMVADHPLVGVGHGVYRQAITPYATSSDPAMLLNLQSQPHNLLLHVMAETGAVGLIGFSLVIGLALFRVAGRVRARRAVADQAALVSLVILVTVGVLHFMLFHQPVAIVFWFFVGVAAGPWPQRVDRTTT